MNRLTVDCGSGESRRESLHDPQILGPIDASLDEPEQDRGILLGLGALHSGSLPGTHRLVVCGPSSLWGGFYVSTMGSAGLPLAELGIDLIRLRGRAERPSVLRVAAEGVRVEPVDAGRLWAEGGVAGVLGMAAGLSQHDGAWALAVGPAAAVSRFAAIGSAPASRPDRIASWAGRGGLGSELCSRHGLVAVLLDAPRRDPDLAPRATGETAERFRFDPRLKHEGTLAANLSGLAERVLCFNGRNVTWPRDRRQRVFDELIDGRLLEQVRARPRGGDRRHHCGEACPIACRREHEGRRIDFQPYASLGPNLGVFDLSQIGRLHDACDRAGFDAVELGGVLAFALERDATGRFDPRGFDPEADSQANAEAALSIVARLLDGQAPDLCNGVAAAARSAGTAEREHALFVGNGSAGGIAPVQFWSPGVLAPGALVGRYHTYFGVDHLPVARLGQLCAERAVRELAMDNLGLCRFQQEWAEDQLSELLRRAGGRDLDVVAHHRCVARRLLESNQPRPWETRRAREMISGHLQACRDLGEGDADLDAWLEDFSGDHEATAGRYWQALLDAVREGLSD